METNGTVREVTRHRPRSLHLAPPRNAGGLVRGTHCGFNAPELVAGWESLRGWIGGAPQPTAASIQGLCQLIGPASQCRIDPGYVVGEFDARIPPR